MEISALPGLEAVDAALLNGLVRQDQNSATFEVLDWTVEPLNHQKIISTTGGLFRFSGQGRENGETRPWSIVLKVLNNPDGEETPDPKGWAYWKREMLAFESGVLADLPDGLRAPRCYGVTERENGAWIWMEHIVEATEAHWSLEQFGFAARQAGRFSGAYLTGKPLPDYLWFTSALRNMNQEGSFWSGYMNPASSFNAWQDKLVQERFVEPLRSGILRIWSEGHLFFDVLDRLPQVFCHNDLHRRNLMLRNGMNGQQELVALDWSMCGIGALGTDLGELVATSLYFFDADPEQAAELEAAVLEGYQAGLRDAGWSGAPSLVRLGYLLSAAVWQAGRAPGWTAGVLGDNPVVKMDVLKTYGRPSEQVIAGWITLTEFLLERADEARHLVSKLGLG